MEHEIRYRNDNWVSEIFLGSEERPVRKAETLTAIDESIVKKM
jgi:hypothetical protein